MVPREINDDNLPDIHDVARLLTVFTAVRKRHELTANELHVLVHTLALGRTSATELSELCGLNLASTGALIERMVTAGWLTRSIDPNDRRRQLVFPTKRLARTAQHELERLGRSS